MPSLPISTAFTDSAVTEAGFKTAITNQREFLADLLGTTGTKLTALRTLGTLANDIDTKSSAYTVVAADMGKVLICTGTFTLSLTAAATLGDGFSFVVKNNGTGVITIDPNSTEQIDGASTKTLNAGDWYVVTCTGTTFNTFGYSVPPAAGITLLGTVAAGSGNSVSLTGLNLTTYKRLWITLSNIRCSVQSYMYISSNNINTNNHYIALASANVTGSSNLLIDLTNGTVVGGSAMFPSPFEKTNMSTSSTAIYFRLESTNTYNNASASIKVYGEK